jgi:hypothetical protein
MRDRRRIVDHHGRRCGSHDHNGVVGCPPGTARRKVGSLDQVSGRHLRSAQARQHRAHERIKRAEPYRRRQRRRRVRDLPFFLQSGFRKRR